MKLTLLMLTAWLAAGQVAFSQPRQADESPAPGWAVGFGAFYMNFDLDFTGIHLRETHAGGGFVSAEYQFLSAFSAELAFGITPDVQASVEERDFLLRDDLLQGSVDVQAITMTLSGKFYPLRLPQIGRHWRVQPYLIGGIGAAFVPLELRGSYAALGEMSRVRVRLTEAFGILQGGAGLEFAPARAWTIFADAQYLSSFAEPEVGIRFSATDFERGERLSLEGFFARAGFRYRF